MQRFIATGLLVVGSVNVHAQVETPWYVNRKVLACSPSVLHEGGTLRLGLGRKQGREMMITRTEDRVGYMLVVGSPPPGVFQLMTPEELSKRRTVELKTTIEATPWLAEARNVERVFSKSGEYRIHVSDNLESEAGGYWCKVRYVARQE